MKTKAVAEMVRSTIREALYRIDLSIDDGIDQGKIDQIIDMCQQKILGNGDRDYQRADVHRFETMSLPELLNYSIDERTDEINYNVFAIYRMLELQEELQLRGVLWTEKHEQSTSGSLVSEELTMQEMTDAGYTFGDLPLSTPDSSETPTS